MNVDTIDVKRHVHELIEQLGSHQVAVLLQLLEVMLEPRQDGDTETLSEEDRRAVARSREYFRKNPGSGVPFEQFAAECGFTMDQVLGQD